MLTGDNPRTAAAVGQAAGIACALAEKGKLDMIQAVDYRKIVDIIEKDPYMDGTPPDRGKRKHLSRLRCIIHGVRTSDYSKVNELAPCS